MRILNSPEPSQTLCGASHLISLCLEACAFANAGFILATVRTKKESSYLRRESITSLSLATNSLSQISLIFESQLDQLWELPSLSFTPS